MSEAPGARKSPYAIPASVLVGDAQVSHEEMVVEQPHEPPPDLSTDHGDGGD